MQQCYCITDEEAEGLTRLIGSVDQADVDMAASAIKTLKRERDYIDKYNMHIVLKLPIANNNNLTFIVEPTERKSIEDKVRTRTSDYVCVDCGQQFLNAKQRANPRVCTFHQSNCCLCGEEKGVTHIRNYNYLNTAYAKPETRVPLMDLARALGLASSVDSNSRDKS